ncbi:SRPBCC family protein [uncultured Jatrophihabitans sp.]|uniref:SRPBCC family protein n=1 Tax=uncultured Jatrophihabitans sp. TaxID=1610747 RepID=UPI0035CC667A
MASETGGLTATVAAPPDVVLAALLDVESYPSWQTIMKSCVVRERDTAGRPLLVDFTVDAKVRTVRYTSRYSYDLPQSFRWTMAHGDLKRNDGRYRLTPRADGGTDVTVDIWFEVGFYVPGPVKALIRDQSLRNSVRELRRHLRL